MPTNRNSLPKDLAILRLLVGYLGEKPQYAWWDTNFLSPIGQQFMTINFPRTALSASIHSVTEAARRLHDERIGKGGVNHLFRLPAALEEDVHNAILTGEANLSIDLVNNQHTALDELGERATKKSVFTGGPKLIGTIIDLQQLGILEHVAAIYFHGFSHNTPCFPYFNNE